MYERLNGKKNGLLRTNSICPTPETVLLDLVLRNDCENITRLVETNSELLDHVYYPEYNKPILLIACSEENVEPQTVKTLIGLGADVRYSSEIDEEWEPIHFAACGTKSEILKVIVDSLKNPGDINSVAKGNNALHILIKHGRSDLEEQFKECAEILIDAGIDVNQADSNFVSPILWAAKRGQKGIIKVILERSLLPVDIDTHQSRRKTARDIIQSENLYDGVLPEKTDNNNDSEEVVLFKYLQTKNENGIINFRNGDIFDLVNADNKSTTLLQMSCDKNLIKATKHLLDKGADPNKTTERNRRMPIEIAAENGYVEVFKILLNHPKIVIPRRIIITLLKFYDKEEFPEVHISHAQCCNLLLKKLKSNEDFLDINEQDEIKNTPLHYAVRFAQPEKVEELLNLGASLGGKNKYGSMPVQDIEPEILEKHLDNCVQFDLKGKNLEKEDFSVTFNYRTLIPPTKKSEFNVIYENNDPETNFNHVITRELVAETEVISYMSSAPELKHLLKHPVIVSFLFMKWHRIRWLFYTNLAFYVAFFLSLVVYIFTSYANFADYEKSSFESFVVHASWVILLISYFILVFRELFQIAVSPNNYFKNFENYIEIVLICFTGSILFIKSPTDDTRKQLSSVSLLLAAFELVLMVGQHPKLSTNVVMLRTVSFNFFKFLMWYSLLIIAFALSFYILFTKTDDVSKNETNSEDDEEDLFTDAGKSLFKTIVMLTGEFDAGSMNFRRFPITSKIIFSLFIFMIAIILLNLLNGLAVSDTQMIKNDAELVGHIARAQHIRYVESMLMGNILPTNVLNKINSVCCCFPINTDWSFALSKPLAEKVCIFPRYLNYELTFYPNKGGQIILPFTGKKNFLYGTSCVSCSYTYLDKETVRRTKGIVQARREELKVKHEDDFLQKIDKIIKSLEKNASKENMEIYILNRKMDNIINYLSSENNS